MILNGTHYLFIECLIRKLVAHISLVDIDPKWAYSQSGIHQKFYCILLLPTSGGILQLVREPDIAQEQPPMGPHHGKNKTFDIPHFSALTTRLYHTSNIYSGMYN